MMTEHLLQELDDDNFTDAQRITLATVPRIAACISLVSSGYMAVAAFRQRRSRIYHRLMFGLTIHMIQYSVWNIYGPAAVPVGTPNVWGAAGNTKTCTAQGFFLQIASQAGYFYYVLLAAYSFQAVRNNFNEEKYIWMEKWIHVAVHVWPIGTAFYLLSIEAFNSLGHYSCWISSIPFGCGNDTGIVCERGPQNLVTVSIIFAAVPYTFILVFPTIVMIALYFEVRKRQSSIQLKASMVAMQAGVYLLALYWAFVFAFINNILQKARGAHVFVTSLLSVVNMNLNGFWMLLIYLYFRVSPASSSEKKSTATSAGGSSVQSLFTPGELTSIEEEDNAIKEEPHRNNLAFNIFDGTSAGGAFAQFVFDADSDDEQEDRKESVRWDHDVQKYI